MSEISKKINYYFWASYRRRLLDEFQEKYSHLYHGQVLDIGGRDRGKFIKPKNTVERWIFADIEKKHRPDIVLDVAKMDMVGDESIDVINAMELFEHVLKIDDGLDECRRVLKTGGTMLISVPFLHPVHADPYDYQRWTKEKWQQRLTSCGYKVISVEVMGGFFTVLGDMIKFLFATLPRRIKFITYPLYPIVDLVVLLDKTHLSRHRQLQGFHGGYFIILNK